MVDFITNVESIAAIAGESARLSVKVISDRPMEIFPGSHPCGTCRVGKPKVSEASWIAEREVESEQYPFVVIKCLADSRRDESHRIGP